jgi:hypothetical protein
LTQDAALFWDAAPLPPGCHDPGGPIKLPRTPLRLRVAAEASAPAVMMGGTRSPRAARAAEQREAAPEEGPMRLIGKPAMAPPLAHQVCRPLRDGLASTFAFQLRMGI